MLDLSTIKFAVDTSALDAAVNKVAALGTSIQGLAGAFKVLDRATSESAKTQAEATTAATKTAQVADKVSEATKGTTEAIKAATEASKTKAKVDNDATESLSKSFSVQERQTAILEFMTQGYSKGQSSVLAYAKSLGSLENDLKTLGDTLQSQRTLQGGDPFDKSLGALRSLQNEFKVLKEVQRLYNAEIPITQKQMESLALDKIRLIEAMKIEGKTLTDVKTAIRNLNSEYITLAGAINTAEAANKSVIDTNNKAASANAFLERELQKVRAATDGANSELNRSTSNAIVRFDNALKASGKTLSEQTVLLNEYKAAQISLQKTAASRNTDYISRAVAPQITDIVVGLSTGQNPLTVLLQQGGQLRDQLSLARVEGTEMANVMRTAMSSMAVSIKDTGLAIGSMLVGGFVDAGKAVLGFIGMLPGLKKVSDEVIHSLYATANSLQGIDKAREALMAFGPLQPEFASLTGIVYSFEKALAAVRATMIGITAIGLVGAIGAIVSLGVAFFQVSKENDDLTKSLALTGGSLALAHTSALNYIRALTAVGGTTGEATQVLIAMAKAGNLTSSSIMQIGESAMEMSKWSGLSIEEIVRQYSKLKDKPVEASIELAKATGMISPALLKNIIDLEQQGKHLAAGELAMKAYSDVTRTQIGEMKENYTSFYSFIIKLKDGVAEFFSTTFKSIMIAKDPSVVLMERAKTFQTALKNMQETNKASPGSYSEDDIRNTSLELEEMNKKIAVQKQLITLKEYEQAQNTKAAVATEYYKNLRENGQTKEVKAQQEIDKIRERMLQDAKDNVLVEKDRLSALGAIQKLQEQIDGRPRVASTSLDYHQSNEAALMEKEFNQESTLQKKYLANSLKDAKTSYELGYTTRAEFVAKERELLDEAYTNEDSAAENAIKTRTELLAKDLGAMQDAYDRKMALNQTYHKRDRDLQAANAALAKELGDKSQDAVNKYEAFVNSVSNKQEANKDSYITRQTAALVELAGNLSKAKAAMITYNEATRHRNEMIDEGIKNQDLLRWATPEEAAVIRANAEAVKYYTTEISKLNKEKADALISIEDLEKQNLGPDSKEMQIANERLVRAQKDINTVIADQRLGIDNAAANAHAAYYKDVFKEVANVISGSITDALFNGGASGTKMLRDYLIKVLKQKITLEIEVSLVKPAMEYAASFLGLPGSSGTGGSGGILSGIFGTANTANSVSSLGSLYNKAAGYLGMDTLGTAAVTQGSVAAATETASLYGGVGAAVEGGSLMAGASSAGPYALAAVAAYELLKGNGFFGGNGGYVNSLGEGALRTSSETGTSSLEGPSSKMTTDYLVSLQKTYTDTILSLGGKAKDTLFTYGANDSNGGKFRVQGGIQGSSLFDTGESITSDVNLKAAAAQAVFTALQQSDLPKYLSGVFDGLTAGTMTQAQIDAVLVYAKGIQTLHTTLEAMPWTGLHDLSFAAAKGLIDLSGGLDKLLANLGTFYQNFYTQAEQTDRSTTLLSKAFADLGIVMPAVDANMRMWYRSEVERVMALDQSSVANQQALVSILGLQSSVNTLAPAFDSTTTAATTASGAISAVAAAFSAFAVKDAAVTDLSNKRIAAANAAYTALQKATDAEKARITLIEKSTQDSITALTAQQSALTSSMSTLTSLFTLLKTNIDQLYNQVPSTNASAFSTARSFITSSANTAVSTGALPNLQAITDAIGTVRTGLDAKVYATAQDAARDRLILADELSKIQGVTGTQMTAQEQQLAYLKTQIDTQNAMLISLGNQKVALDNMLADYKSQLDNLISINTGVTSIASGIDALVQAMNSLKDVLAFTKAPASGVTDAWSTVTTPTGDVNKWVSSSGAVGTQTDTGVQIKGVDNTVFSGSDAIAYVNNMISAGTPEQIYAEAIKKGISAKSLDALMGWTPGTSNDWAAANNLPKFASGGSYAGGMALVGEKGAELINFNQPGQVYNNTQTQNLLGGLGDNSELVSELQMLRSEVSMLRAEARSTAISTSKLNLNIERSIVPTTSGDAILVKTAT